MRRSGEKDGKQLEHGRMVLGLGVLIETGALDGTVVCCMIMFLMADVKLRSFVCC